MKINLNDAYYVINIYDDSFPETMYVGSEGLSEAKTEAKKLNEKNAPLRSKVIGDFYIVVDFYDLNAKISNNIRIL